MSFAELKRIIFIDLYRNHDKAQGLGQLIYFLVTGDAFKLLFFLRVYTFLSQSLALKVARIPVGIILNHYRRKYGIYSGIRIGEGFCISHCGYGSVIISPDATIGINCNISPGVVIGLSNRGPKRGCPTIGDQVYMGPGAKIIGKIHVGSNVVIGANAVVTKDIPDNAVVAGIPARIISYQGADRYISDLPPRAAKALTTDAA